MTVALVTGCGGFLGGALAESLLARGDRVIALAHTDKPPEHRPKLREARWFRCDVADAEAVRDIIARYEPEEVYHYAASSLVRGAVRDPVGAVRTNVLGTAAVLEACRLTGGARVIYISNSDKAFGEPPNAVDEDAPLRPRHIYDATKACTDHIAQAYAEDYRLPIIITRSCNVFGPGDLNWSRIVPNACRAIVEGGRPRLYAQATRMAREFIYVGDHVAAALFVVGKLRAGEIGRGEVFNVGTGDVLSVEALLQRLVRVSGADCGIEVVPRDGDFAELLAQSVKSDKLRALGWESAVPLDAGLALTYRWYEHYLRGGSGR